MDGILINSEIHGCVPELLVLAGCYGMGRYGMDGGGEGGGEHRVVFV